MASQRSRVQPRAPPPPPPPQRPARTLAEVTVGNGLQGFAGKVVQRQLLRPIDAEDEEVDVLDVGPKARNHQRVFVVVLLCAVGSCTTKIYLYAYDEWAEKIKFLHPDDLVVITSGPAVVNAHPYGENRFDDDHPCCLTLEHGIDCAIEVPSVLKMHQHPTFDPPSSRPLFGCPFHAPLFFLCS